MQLNQSPKKVTNFFLGVLNCYLKRSPNVSKVSQCTDMKFDPPQRNEEHETASTDIPKERGVLNSFNNPPQKNQSAYRTPDAFP